MNSSRYRRAYVLSAMLLAAFLLGLTTGQRLADSPSTPTFSSPATSSVFVRFPYLMQPRPDGIVIAWLTPRSVQAGTVRYGQGRILGPPLSSHVVIQSDGVLQSVQLFGLTPNMSYEYEVSSGGDVYKGHFTTLPDTGKLRFAAVGDFGGGTAAEITVAELMQQQDPDLFISLGDNTYESGRLDEMDKNVFPAWRAFLSTHGADWVMGNHDYATQKGRLTLQNFFMPAGNYAFDVGDMHFTILEGDGSPGYGPGQPTYLFLKQDLASHLAARWKFVFFHYPTYSCGEHPSTDWVDRYWVPLFTQYQVDAVFNGHSHDYERVKVDSSGVHYFVAGNGGKDLAGFHSDCSHDASRANSFYGDLLVTVTGGTIQVDAVQADGSVFDSVTWSKPQS